MNWHEFGLGVPALQVFCNAGLALTIVGWGIRFVVAVVKGLR